MGWLGMECISSYHMNGPHVMTGWHFILFFFQGGILKYKPGMACSEKDSPKSNIVRILSFPNFNDLEGGLFNRQHFCLPKVYKI